MRYTGNRIYEFVTRTKEICPHDHLLGSPFFNELEQLFYVRPTGFYTDRQGKKYEYTREQRREDLLHDYYTAVQYTRKINRGASEEDARGVLSFDFRQHFVVSFSLRALMHFMDLRAKKDAQLEIRQLCELMWPHFEAWTPEVADWYLARRWGKARLAP
jgi:thymidylate synthase (FAD)